MIKTLRITGVLVVVLAVVFFVLPAVFGVRSDEGSEQFLSSPSAIEKFNEAKGEKIAKSDSQVSPLVKEAEAFGLYLNPPKPKAPPRRSARERAGRAPRPPAPVSAKFDLVGTSYYALRPELSLALINEPGKGFHWVRQSSEVGHLIIEEIGDGVVVVRDGKRTIELEVERPKKRSLVKGSISDARITSAEPSPISDGEEELLERLFVHVESTLPGDEEVEAREEGISGKLESSARRAAEEARAEKIFAELEAMRVGDEEARRLGRLGERLRKSQRDKGRAGDGKVEVDANLSEPNLAVPGANDIDLGEANSPE
ncbi:MAG: hypothetical protein JSV99_06010 [Planctomycetota bacterium]|nr:MAG: hypothetical protein JSV99_06010 [Planctomycetota bacterium]